MWLKMEFWVTDGGFGIDVGYTTDFDCIHGQIPAAELADGSQCAVVV